MYIIVDERNQYVTERPTEAEAEAACRWWNETGRFMEWGEPEAHIVKGD